MRKVAIYGKGGIGKSNDDAEHRSSTCRDGQEGDGCRL